MAVSRLARRVVHRPPGRVSAQRLVDGELHRDQFVVVSEHRVRDLGREAELANLVDEVLQVKFGSAASSGSQGLTAASPPLSCSVRLLDGSLKTTAICPLSRRSSSTARLLLAASAA